MYTREEFEELRLKQAESMADDQDLQEDALDVFERADRYHWIHQTNWFGEPVLNLPQDMFALQEIIFNTRPDYIIELGVAWGGSTLFHATLLEVLGGEEVIGVDIYMPDDLKERLGSHGSISERIRLINASSVEKETLDEIKEIIGDTQDVLVILDSNHTHDHVLQELEMYAPLVGEGNYLVCCDTIVNEIPEQTHRPRPWGPEDNPRTALEEFLGTTDRFERDDRLEKKLLFTCNPNGYLRCVRE